MRIHSREACPMRDGTALHFDLYRPDSGGACPAIVMRTPYGRDKIHKERIYQNIALLTDAGYSVVVMDLRGTGDSEGTFRVNTENEYEDGYDAVEWVAAQPWCNGKVGMFGLSYFGFTQLAAASLNPPSLKAICPFMTQALDPFGAHMNSHTINDLHLNWIYAQLMEFPEHYLPDPEFRARVMPVLRGMWENLDQIKNELPANRNRAALIEGVPMLQDYLALLNGIEDAAYWVSLRHPTDFSALHLGVFHLTGWFDVTRDTTIRNYRAILQQADDYTTRNSILLIGPWEHGGYLNHVQDGYDFGEENSGIRQRVPELMRGWFDAYLKDEPEKAERLPRVRYFVMGDNAWRTAGTWPPEDSRAVSCYLHEGGRLSLSAPEAEGGHTAYAYDPLDPTPSFFTDSRGRRMLPDLREWAQSRADVISFSTEPLQEAMTVAGTVSALIYAATDAVDTDFVCRLVDVFPDGTEMELTSGLVRAKYRNGMWVRDFAPCGEVNAYRFEVGNTANTFLPGHRVKVYVCSALYPLYDRNLNTGAPACQGTETVVAHQRVCHSKAYPSQIILPVIEAQ